MTCAEIEPFYLGRGDVNVIWPRKVIIILRSQETVPLLHHFENTGSKQFALFLGTGLENAHDQFLFFQTGITGDFHLLSELG